MDLKVTLCALALLAGLSTATVAQEGRRTYTPAEYFRNYALSTCLADGFGTGPVMDDASAAARAYLEFGDLPLEAHTEATRLGREFLKREYKSLSGQPLTTMKCIDFVSSPELARILKKYRRRG